MAFSNEVEVDKLDAMIGRLVGRFALGTVLSPWSLGAQAASSCGQITYEDRNQTDYGPLRVGVVEGHVRDAQGVAIPNVCVALFNEPHHKLVATTQTDAKGRFRFRPVAGGGYRLVAKYEAFCPANVILQVQPTARKSLRVHMRPAGIDTCSYVD